jgi:superfamily II DNA or RNA helicase
MDEVSDGRLMDSIIIDQYDEVYVRINCSDQGILYEMSEYFTFNVPNAKFTPKFKNKMWDGKIRLLNLLTRLLYKGLTAYIEKFAQERGYTVHYNYDCSTTSFSLEEARQFCSKLQLTHQPRDYQLEAFAHAIRTQRALLLSPTASGKSFIIFLTMMYVLSRTEGRCLIIVPTTSLVSQMASDFDSYSEYGQNLCHKITAGESKTTKRRVIVSTWQSIYKQPKSWFDQFSIVIGDEAHHFKAQSLTKILTNLTQCQYRLGFTGTLDGTQTHKLVLEGLFGSVKKVTTTAELIEQKHLADFKIKGIVLSYNDSDRKLISSAVYKDEIDWIVRNDKRNLFIKNLTLSLKGNTLVLFQFVEKHGKVLYESLQERENVYFVSGNVDGDHREQIRKIVETQTDAIIVASFGTFSTGVNIKNLHNVIFSSPSKSRTRTLQSIGRGLRRSDTKSAATLYDIADDLSWKSKKNHTLLHFMERVKMYGEEKFDYKIYTVKIGS